jgi:hypothetical protein
MIKLVAAMKGHGEVEPFVIHDVRRTVRTRLSSLRVPEAVAEMVLGTPQRGFSGFTTSTPTKRRCARRWSSGVRY